MSSRCKHPETLRLADEANLILLLRKPRARSWAEAARNEQPPGAQTLTMIARNKGYSFPTATNHRIGPNATTFKPGAAVELPTSQC